jgi:hypothetical protein
MLDKVTPKSGPHRDYNENLRHAEELSTKENTSKINGLRVKVSDSEHLKKALLIISWCPGTTVRKGNYATPIFLHQFNEDFKRTSENVLKFYKKSIKDFENTHPQQPDFLNIQNVPDFALKV